MFDKLEDGSELKKPLENLLATNQNIQAEVQGENNEIIRLGDLSTLNAGLVLLEQRKKFNKKNADSILAKSRSINRRLIGKVTIIRDIQNPRKARKIVREVKLMALK